MLLGVDVVDAVERLGGWIVVVWIVWWLTNRWEKQTEKQWSVVRALVDSMKERKADEDGHRRDVLERLNSIKTQMAEKAG